MLSQEPSWPMVLLCIGAGFLLLFKGADWMVGGSACIARRMGLSVLVIGLTVVAVGTSAPEIVVSGLAAWEGNGDLSLGNVLGSNIANIGLVLGICALVLPSVLEARFAVRELLWLFGSLGLFWWVASDLAITRLEAGTLLAAFVAYSLSLLVGPRQASQPQPDDPGLPGASLKTLLGMAAIGLGAKLAVDGAIGGAEKFGVAPSLIGLTVVAIGTSLPELAAGLGGALKGEKDISLGNVIGSNVFNLIAVIGIVGLIHPLEPARHAHSRAADLEQAFRWALEEDLWVVLGFSLLAVALPFLGGERYGRLKGSVLLAAYAAYIVWLCVTRG